MKPFEYLCPTNIDEALSFVATHGSRAVVMAGGTDVMVSFSRRQISPEYVVDISRLEELKFIRQDRGLIRIGPRTTFTELICSDVIRTRAAVLADAARASAGPQVRNLATIGGNLGTASPAGDLVVALMALNAQVKVASRDGERTLLLDQFLVGPKKSNLHSDELITEIMVPASPSKSGSAFQKLGNRNAMTIAIVSAAASVTLSEDGKYFGAVRLALGSVAPTAVRAKAYEEALTGKPANSDEICHARHLVGGAISPITDIRAAAWYRREVAPVLAGRSVEDALAAALGHERPTWARDHRKKGRGVAAGLYSSTVPAAPNPYSLNMQMREDGSVVVQAGGCDIGQGSNTVIATVTAEALGVDVEKVTVYSADTGTCPYDFGTVSSRQTFAGGNAVLAAAEQVKSVLFESASKKLQVPPNRLVLRPGVIEDKDDPQKSMSIAEASTLSHFVFRQLPTGSSTFYPKNKPPDHNMQGEPIACLYYNAVAAEVAVDPETGVVEVQKLYSVVDAGKAISPMLVEGQVEGGAMQAVGWALREDSHPGLATVGEVSTFEPDFAPADLSNYPIATSMDLPELHAAYVEVPERDGPYGAKAVGEIGALTPTPAILNAIHDAIGVRLFELPASPEKVLRALNSKPVASQHEATEVTVQ